MIIWNMEQDILKDIITRNLGNDTQLLFGIVWNICLAMTYEQKMIGTLFRQDVWKTNLLESTTWLFHTTIGILNGLL